ncbi:2-hydroxyacid dehydrogenase [Pigmentiphaga sp.]|uniref:2-hydroxyacid dehydrogenase n=1 Tax=Pigmentiphaga sp. TaxID=1977564 RepID=UPI0025D280FD|nr:2-hydroxyacid dehydrogenase [Pigmentiphaga sp.]
MSKPVVLNIAKIPAVLQQSLESEFELRTLHSPGDTSEISGLVSSAIRGVDLATLDQLPGLKAMSIFGVGMDKVDLAAARRRGIRVGYTPDVLNDCVADLAIGLMIAASRKIPQADGYVRSHRWAETGNVFDLGDRVSGKRMGIAGMGRIGRIIAKRLVGFDVEIRYFSRSEVRECSHERVSTLQELAAWCDYLFIAVSGSAQTRHMVDAGVLEALGPQGYLINVARGSVVDEQALIAALENEAIRGAALDVYEVEPLKSSRLTELRNTVLLPHVSSATNETRTAMSNMVVENLKRFYAGERMLAEPA